MRFSLDSATFGRREVGGIRSVFKRVKKERECARRREANSSRDAREELSVLEIQKRLLLYFSYICMRF